MKLFIKTFWRKTKDLMTENWTKYATLIAKSEFCQELMDQRCSPAAKPRLSPVTTLGAPGDEQVIDTMEVDQKKRYIHHYNFPPYSVGEVRPMRGPGRREIGHGALAERALIPVIPSKEEFPYTILLVSEILESNGSSSMASTCGLETLFTHGCRCFDEAAGKRNCDGYNCRKR